MRTLGIQNPSDLPEVYEVYKDDVITLWLHDVNYEGKMFVLHARVEPTTDREVLLHIAYVLEILFEQLREKGVKELEAWTTTPEETRYAQFFGFEYLGQLTVNGRPTSPVIDRLKIRL